MRISIRMTQRITSMTQRYRVVCLLLSATRRVWKVSSRSQSLTACWNQYMMWKVSMNISLLMRSLTCEALSCESM